MAGTIDPNKSATAWAMRRSQEDTFLRICSHTENGGSVVELAREWGCNVSDMMQWVYDDKTRANRYGAALKSRNEHVIESVLAEFRIIAHMDPAECLNSEGGVKSLADMSIEARKCISAIEVEEIWAGRGEDKIQVGELKRIKFYNKLEAGKVLALNLKLLNSIPELKEAESLEDALRAVAETWKARKDA